MTRTSRIFLAVFLILTSLGALVFITGLPREAAVENAPQANNDPFANCAGVDSLILDKTNIIIAPRGKRLLSLINISSYLQKFREEELLCRIYVTARALAAERFDEDVDGNITSIDVIIASVENMDEYARPDYAGMRKFGTISFRPGENGPKMTHSDVELPS